MKVNELTDDALNRLIHEKVMGECWHDVHQNISDGAVRCTRCDEQYGGLLYYKHPNYCQDLNAVAKAEAKAIDDGYYHQLVEVLEEVVGADLAHNDDEWCEAGKLAFATARQRAEAVAIAMRLAEI